MRFEVATFDTKEVNTLTTIDGLVCEYTTLEKEKFNVAKKSVRYEMSMGRDTVVALTTLQDRQDKVLKRLIKLVEKCMKKDYDLTNELAQDLYDYYKPRLRSRFF